MKSRRLLTAAIGVAAFAAGFLMPGCTTTAPSSDDIQNANQEQLNQQAVASVGMPAITNFTQKRQLHDILELNDQASLVTYSYVENEIPTIVKGKTVLGGKLTYLGVTIGYGLPYATQYTNPQKFSRESASGGGYEYITMPQADPNGLYMPASAEGTWLIIKCPDGKNRPVYMEPRVAVYPYKLPFD